MLAYMPKARPAAQAGSPRTLMLIVTGHAAVITAVLVAKPEMIGMNPLVPMKVINVPINPPPPDTPPPMPSIEPQSAGNPSTFTVPQPVVDEVPSLPVLPLDAGTIASDPGPVVGTNVPGQVIDLAKHMPVKIAAVFRTPQSAIKPPYPLSKIRSEEEATLKLRLSIDPRGRVAEVDSVGAADAEFLAAARRHIIRFWRYKPAMEDGVAVPSTTVINLSFRLDDA